MTPAEKREAQLKELERTVKWLEGYVGWIKSKKEQGV